MLKNTISSYLIPPKDTNLFSQIILAPRRYGTTTLDLLLSESLEKLQEDKSSFIKLILPIRKGGICYEN